MQPAKRGRTSNEATLLKLDKRKATFGEDGLPSGEFRVPFHNTIGTKVREEVPIIYKDWDEVKREKPKAEENIWEFAFLEFLQSQIEGVE